jgi:predicted transposase YbfD/YdcC
MAWVRETWPVRPDLVAVDGKTSRRSHDRDAGTAPLHLASAFATTSRMVLGQEAVADMTNEITAIPILLERLAVKGGSNGALVSIDPIATNPTIARAIREAGADYLLAVKANQPSLRAEIETFFADASPDSLDSTTDLDRGHGRIEQRTVTVASEVDWLQGHRRFPGERRLPDVATIVRVVSRAELKSAAVSRPDTTSHLQCFRPPAPPRPSAVTGALRTACTRSSTSLSAMTNRD